jgi:hypothetical protein
VCSSAGDDLLGGLVVDLEDAAVVAGGQRRGQAVGPLVQAHHDLLTGVDLAHPLDIERTSAVFM